MSARALSIFIIINNSTILLTFAGNIFSCIVLRLLMIFFRPTIKRLGKKLLNLIQLSSKYYERSCFPLNNWIRLANYQFNKSCSSVPYFNVSVVR